MGAAVCRKLRKNKELEQFHDVRKSGTAPGRLMIESGRLNNNLVDPKLLELLVCPITKGPLKWDASRQELVSRAAGLAYPVRDGVPVMLPSEARALDEQR
jgi:uncharacterized protein YbaR (Trm112 family)